MPKNSYNTLPEVFDDLQVNSCRNPHRGCVPVLNRTPKPIRYTLSDAGDEAAFDVALATNILLRNKNRKTREIAGFSVSFVHGWRLAPANPMAIAF